MGRLNKNQIELRVTRCLAGVRQHTDGLERDDLAAVVRAVVARILPEDAEPEAAPALTAEDLEGKIQAAMRAGLDRSDPQMVRAAMEWQAEQAGREYLRELTVEIVPYTIADTSLKNIVLRAGDDVVREIAGALMERQANGRLAEVEEEEEAG